jgi:flagellum-specific peptidoglycan hydrolase FlgJ
LWVAAYGVKARTEDDFYALLERQYAGDKDYVRKLKKLSLKYKHR